MVEVRAPGATATLKLRNDGAGPLSAQIRVYRWTQVNGEEKLEPTDDVVASPPIANIASKTDYIVRLVRLSKQPLAAPETYRLLVDELPDPAAPKDRAVTLVLRYSIPVFFYPNDAGDAKVAWSVEQRRGKLFVAATNTGDRHVRVAALKLNDASGKTLSFGNGLNGYVLGRSTMRWAAPGNAKLAAGSTIAISAQGDQGPINASSSVQAK
jgi:fimbrial chaperone protein